MGNRVIAMDVFMDEFLLYGEREDEEEADEELGEEESREPEDIRSVIAV